jgi:hypothetical protein
MINAIAMLAEHLIGDYRQGTYILGDLYFQQWDGWDSTKIAKSG